MVDQHKRDGFTYRPHPTIYAWLKAEAARTGKKLGHILDELLMPSAEKNKRQIHD